MSHDSFYDLGRYELIQILLYLDDQDLFAMLSTSKYLNGVADNSFWMDLTIQKFGQRVLQLDVPKLDGLDYPHWSQLYYDLSYHLPTYQTLTYAIEHHSLHLLQWLTYFQIYPEPSEVNQIISRGQLNVISWLGSINYPFNYNYPDWCIFTRQDEILFLFIKFGIKPSNSGLVELIRQDRLSILKRLGDFQIYPGLDGIRLAGVLGRVRILNWLSEQGIYLDHQGIIEAARQGQINILKKIHPYFWTSEMADASASGGQIQVLDWFRHQKVYPTIEGATLAAQQGHLATIDWIYHHFNILPSIDQYILYGLYRDGHLEIIEWLKGIVPDVRHKLEDLSIYY